MSKTKNMFEVSAIINQAITNMEHAIKVVPKSEQFSAGQLRAIIDSMQRVRLDIKTKAEHLREMGTHEKKCQCPFCLAQKKKGASNE